ncbi:Smr/MutS family protein [Novosphingobium sp. JCM 18896]|uniref:Smr/MutS family protein n=1 Tax=Novosphingobium sp. JCM 18896 TaxID=2989731 RepID=UPI00222173F7|nr:Smr/MutS family protein [Novosphingobium sp. JCM 18896]MCW1428761.1 Smr/MutS family protein [Novosphingobium sp. JCM 18896]
MKRPGRKLTADEAALWARVAQTVERLHPPRSGEGDQPQAGGGGSPPSAAPVRKPPPPPPLRAGGPPPRAGEDRKPATAQLYRPTFDKQGLDAGWDRRLSRGLVPPDFTLDLHGATLDAAYSRLDHGLTLALAQGARLVLLVTGRERPSEDRRSRGAIRRKFMDWLAAGSHASRIAAIRPAHQRHGGAGAVYIVLKRVR